MSQDSTTKKAFGMLAEFDSAAALYHACEQVRDAGYTAWDAHTPFPVHGLDKAMGMKRTILPFIVFIAGLTGAIVAFYGQYWANGIDYKFIIAAKPFFSWPAYIPVTFEVMVLFSAFGAVFGMFHLCRLPQLYHPLFNSERFERFSDDRFFISIEAADAKYDAAATRALLEGAGALAVELVEEDAQ